LREFCERTDRWLRHRRPCDEVTGPCVRYLHEARLRAVDRYRPTLDARGGNRLLEWGGKPPDHLRCGEGHLVPPYPGVRPAPVGAPGPEPLEVRGHQCCIVEDRIRQRVERLLHLGELYVRSAHEALELHGRHTPRLGA